MRHGDVLFYPRYKMILEGTLDELMENIGG